MQKLTVGRMAKLYGMHRSTLYEAVSKGRVSTGVDGKGQRVIALSEMIRVYGEPPGRTLQNPTAPTDAAPTLPTAALQPLLEELRLLREEVAQLRQSLLLLEHRPAALAEQEPEKALEIAPAPARSFADLLEGLG